MKCERCGTDGHEAGDCHFHTQYPYGLSRWEQIDLLRGALEAAVQALAPQAQAFALCKEALEKTDQAPPAKSPP